LHVLVVIVLQAVAVIMVVMIVAMVVMIMVVVMIVGLQKVRLDVEDAVEVESATIEHVGQRHRAALGAVEFRIGVDGADAGLDLGELGLGDEVGLVQLDVDGTADPDIYTGPLLDAFPNQMGMAT